MGFTHMTDVVDANPYVTRGKFNPNAVNNAAHLPLQEDCVATQNPIVQGDSFILTTAYTYASTGGETKALVAGDRIVYIGGTLTTEASWCGIREAYKYAGRRLDILGESGYTASNM